MSSSSTSRARPSRWITQAPPRNHQKDFNKEKVPPPAAIDRTRVINMSSPCDATRLLHQLEDGECKICLQPGEKPVKTGCGHGFGRECIIRVVRETASCPMCRKPLGCGVLRSVVIEDENLEGHSKDDDDENDVEDEEEWGQRGEEEMESDGEAEEAGQEAETEVESRANENAPLGGNGDLRQRRQSGLKDACVRAALQ